MDEQRTTYFTKRAKSFLKEKLSAPLYARVMVSCNNRPTWLDATNILLIASNTNTEPWELINEHGLGRSRQWLIDDLNQLTSDYSGAELCVMHTSAA